MAQPSWKGIGKSSMYQSFCIKEVEKSTHGANIGASNRRAVVTFDPRPRRETPSATRQPAWAATKTVS